MGAKKSISWNELMLYLESIAEQKTVLQAVIRSKRKFKAKFYQIMLDD